MAKVAEVKRAGHRDLPRKQVVITLGGVMLAQFLASLDQTVVGTAMPRIVTDLGGFSEYTWVVTAYMIATTVTVPIVGKLSDMFGRKWFLTAGIAIFIIGSILCGISQTMMQLIAFRAFQGIGAGAIMGMAFTIIGDLFPPAERGKYAGFMAGVFGLSSIIGPTLGGFITDNLSWHWVFFVNVPLGVVAIFLFVFFFPHVRPALRKHSVDYAGITTLIFFVVSLMLALSWAGVEYAWDSTQIMVLFDFSALMLLLFVIVEMRAKEPILPLWILRNRIVGVSFLTIFFTGFAMFAGIIFIPLFFQGVLGKSATASGSFLTPMMLGMICGSLISGQLLSRAGGHYRLQGGVGIAIMAVGLYLLSRMTAETGYATAVMNIVISGFGLGITMPVYTIAVQNAVPYSVMGIATSSTQFFRSLGGAFGLTVAGSVMNSRFTSEFFGNLPSSVSAVMPNEQLSRMVDNPQVLFSSDALSQLKAFFEGLGAQGMQMFDQLLATLRGALSSALSEVFLVALGVVAAAFIINLFIKEIPLRKHL
jgi:EmrB/QacA subfamily drug resistance transporter